MKFVGPKLETGHLQVSSVPDTRWLRRVGDEVVGTTGTIFLDEEDTLTLLPEHDTALVDAAPGAVLTLPASLPVGWKCRVYASSDASVPVMLRGDDATLLLVDAGGWVLVSANVWAPTVATIVKTTATQFDVLGQAWPTDLLDARLVASGGGAAATTHTITVPALPPGALGAQVLIVRTGNTSTTHAITNDASDYPFQQVATRDSTGRTTVFARPVLAGAVVDASVTLSLAASRAAAWTVITIPDAFATETLANWITATFADSNTLDPPSATLGDGYWAYRLTAATTRRTDNTLTAPTNTALLASGQSTANSSSNNETRVSLAADPEPNGGAFNPSAFGSTGTTNTTHAVAILVAAPYFDANPYSPEWSELRGDPRDNSALRSVLDAVRVHALTLTAYTLESDNAGKLVTLTNSSAITLTVPTNASVPFPVGTVIALAQLGAGLVTVEGASGVTINGTTPGDADLSGQWATATLTKLDTNTWLLSGGLA